MEKLLRTDLLPTSLPTLWLAVLACLAMGLLLGLHILFARQKRRPAFRLLCTFPVGAMACWLVLQLTARFIMVATPWPLWAMAMIGAGSVEGAICLYAHEGSLCSPALRRTLLSLRLIAVTLLCLMLVQPVIQRNVERHIRRRVAVLIDTSASMSRADTFWTSSERLDVAQSLGEIPSENRPLRLATFTNQTLRARLAYWSERLGTPESAEMATQQNNLYDEAKSAAAWTESLSSLLLKHPAPAPIPDSLRADNERLQALQLILTNQVAPAWRTLAGNPPKSAAETTPNKVPRDLKADLATVQAAVDALNNALPDASASADALLLASLDAATTAAISNACSTSRIDLAKHLLRGVPEKQIPSLFDKLSLHYDLQLYTFAKTPLRLADPKLWLTSSEAASNITAAVTAERSETDITRAIETVLQDIPTEERAGLLLLTDGCHTGDSGVEAVAKLLGQTQTHVSAVVIGGTEAPFDFSIDAVRAQESVFLGDKVRLTATLSATGAAGAKTQIVLKRDGKVVDTEAVEIEGSAWQAEFRLEDLPDTRGTYHYELAIENDSREILKENNVWSMDVAVSDNRTNVLLADSRPRWEFRYLRNLFYGRDKSIHLQYFLSEPDTIRGLTPEKPLPPASASREFGDAESGSLPASLEEWRKFDVIILGDLDEKVLTPSVVESIKHCVEVRGATLICIAGPTSMPYAITNTLFQAMLPVTYSTTNHLRLASEPFNVEMTTAGRSHPIMSLSSSQAENESIWSAQPPWLWRLPIADIKPGAEILAIARSASDSPNETFILDSAAKQSPQAAVAAFAEQRKQQMRQAILVTQTDGMGKVMMLLSDRTWRLRYCIGDTLHHRFWGQVMRWGAGEQLRAGNLFARFGTDRVSYTPEEPIIVRARLSDGTLKPLANLTVQASVMNAKNQECARLDLTYRENSNGLYEGTLLQPLEPGSYKVVLDAPGLGGILGDNLPKNLECPFSVITARRPKEFAHVTADWRVPRILATQSGGKALSPVECARLETDFGEPSRTVIEHVEITLWSCPWILLALIIVLTTEWILRKKGGLT